MAWFGHLTCFRTDYFDKRLSSKYISLGCCLIFYRIDDKYLSKSLATYARRYSVDNNLKPGPTHADFDNYLYDLAEKVWPHVIQLIEDDFGGAV